ncbi:hypothetical protein J6590_041518 [Homalodisca vitripennis]|nr:hypothetical protein J6590_041518 [Homalodisca vitripennis]
MGSLLIHHGDLISVPVCGIDEKFNPQSSRNSNDHRDRRRKLHTAALKYMCVDSSDQLIRNRPNFSKPNLSTMVTFGIK